MNTVEFEGVINGFNGVIILDDYNGWLHLGFKSTDAYNWLHEDRYRLDFDKDLVVETDKSKYAWHKDDKGFIYFGSQQKYNDYDHSAGYVWSSRASVFNANGQEQAMECSVGEDGNHTLCAGYSIALDEVKSVVRQARNAGVLCDIVRIEEGYDDTSCDVAYKIVDELYLNSKPRDYQDYVNNDGSYRKCDIISCDDVLSDYKSHKDMAVGKAASTAVTSESYINVYNVEQPNDFSEEYGTSVEELLDVDDSQISL